MNSSIIGMSMSVTGHRPERTGLGLGIGFGIMRNEYMGTSSACKTNACSK